MLGAGFFLGMVGGPLVTDSAFFPDWVDTLGSAVYEHGWLMVLGESLLLGWWTAQRPLAVAGGLACGLVGLACGWALPLAIFWMFPHGPDL